MSSEAVRAIIESRLSDEWGTTTPITWDNVTRNPTAGTSFIACSISGVHSELLSISCQRETYLLIIEVFTPKGEGAKSNMVLADTLTGLFFGFTSGYLTCTTGRVDRVGNENEWHKRNVLIDIRYDQHF